MKKPQRTQSQIVDELRLNVRNLEQFYKLTPAQIVTYLAMVASDYAPRAFVDLKSDNEIRLRHPDKD